MVDWRKQLFNHVETGPIELVQLPAEAITRLHGILFDLDPSILRPELASGALMLDPEALFGQVVRPWLERHPALKDAEVVCSGRGLHVIPWLDRPVEFTTDGERRKWAGIVRAVQAVLPTDPDAPGITALTRPVGSVNAKNGAVVRRLKNGHPVSVDAILDLFAQMRIRPFRTVMRLLFGDERVAPCPVCRTECTSLAGLDRHGRCYGSCGTVPLFRLYDVFLLSRPPTAKQGGDAHGQD
jgi:hypothetical protein